MANSNHESSDDNDDNPYEGHPHLSPLQAEILGEYVKLNRALKSLTALTRELNESPNDTLLLQLRSLERQMGLVLTLFKASVWSLHAANQEAEEELEGEGDRTDSAEDSSPRSFSRPSDGDVMAVPAGAGGGPHVYSRYVEGPQRR